MGEVSDIFIELEELGFSWETIEEAVVCFPPFYRAVNFLKAYAGVEWGKVYKSKEANK